MCCSMSEKVSRYIVISDQDFLSSSGQKWRIIYGTRKAKLLAVEAEIADALARHAVPEGSPATLAILRKHEFLVDDGGELERDTLTRRGMEASTSLEGDRTFTLVPTTFCNMGCTYCGQEHFKSSLSPRHRAAIVDRVCAAISSKHRTRVTWFGGEPMMAYSVICQMSEIFVATASSHNIDYIATMTTNGSLLTVGKLANLHSNCGIGHIEITLDGAEDMHDLHRPIKSGGKSFRKITTTLSQALKSPELHGLTFGIRTNVDQRNVDSIPEFIEQMAELGFQNPRIRFTFAPVHPWSNDISEIELANKQFAEQEVLWLSMLLDRGLHFDIVPTVIPLSVCVAVDRKAETLTSTGQIFNCLEQPLVPAEAGRAIGRITDLALTSPRPDGPFDTWIEDRVSGHYPCGDCVMLGVCGGRCPKAWTDGSVPCPSYRYNIQDRLELAARVHGLEPVVTSR